MKRILLLLLLPSLIFAGEVKPKSTIKEVTIYRSGAQVTSEAAVNLPKGVSEVYLTGLSPLIDQNSIQISGLKDASILSISYSVNYIDKKADTGKMKLIEAQLAEKSRSYTVLQNLITGFREEQTLLTTNRKLNGEQQSLTVAQVTAFAQYYRERHAAIQTEIYDASIKSNAINKEISDLQQEYSKLTNDSREQRGEILVKIDAPAPVALNLITKYNVSQAGWFPIYDIKTQGIKQPLSIFYKAHVYQNTGEDWSDVKVTLSTGDPNINNNKPEVLPQYLNFIQEYRPVQTSTKSYGYKYNPTVKKVTGTVIDQLGMPIPGVNVLEQGTNNGVQTDFDGKYTLTIGNGQNLAFTYIGMTTQILPIYAQQMNVTLDEDVQTLDEVVVEGYRNTSRVMSNVAATTVTSKTIEGRPNVSFIGTLQGQIPGLNISEGAIKEMGVTNVVFKIEKPYSIDSTQEVTVITIDQFDLPAKYEYFTAPLLNENVFLTARVKDWEKFDLLPGEANIYFEGSFAGKTFLDPLQTTEELVISLGVDPNVIVERKQVDDLKAKSFLGGTRIISKNYEITVRNNKATDIELVLMDRIPVSQNKEIKVEEVKTGGADYDEKKGLLTWKLNMKPKESVKKQLSYEVRYPKEKRVNM
ncbi:mucoidy inhibitor MuiA family protein [Flavobacterium sp. DGU11]|uniref:Mucoidy inhibitor MuiA family protein n=1 Tax=Flavobacterium arundinis TaxID=3139143 RepID=A0ABU9HT11_9FLAO